MKPTKILMCALAVGAVIFATSKVYALQGTITVSGTALVQDSHGVYDVVKKHKLSQKDVLFLLEQATGDTSITNKHSPTKLIYDPNATNTAAYFSNEGIYWGGTLDTFYGIFYYSNSVSGLVRLDGTDGLGDYYSYIEFDYVNWVLEDYEGFWNQYAVEYNSILSAGPNKDGATGNGILYIHSNGYYYNLPQANQSCLFFANDYYGYYQEYALVMRGMFQFNESSSGSHDKESLTIKGSGDGVWYSSDTGMMPIVVNGTAKFSAKD